MEPQFGRALPIQEVKAASDGSWEVSGYISTFKNVDLGGDAVLPGAFDETLASGRKVKFLFSHKQDAVLGVPLTIKPDDKGLWGKFKISRTRLGEEVHTLLKDGALDSFSIGYIPTDVEYDGDHRLLKSVELLEASVVPIPMNPEAVVTAVKEAGSPVGDDLDIVELKPFPSEHACRIADPSRFDRFRRQNGAREHDGKKYDVIFGHPKSGGGWEVQSLRYPKGTWSAEAARSHCASHKGSFEAASGGSGKSVWDDEPASVEAKQPNTEPSEQRQPNTEQSLDGLLADIHEFEATGLAEVKALFDRRITDHRSLSDAHLEALRGAIAAAEAYRDGLVSVLRESEAAKAKRGIDPRFGELLKRQLSARRRDFVSRGLLEHGNVDDGGRGSQRDQVAV